MYNEVELKNKIISEIMDMFDKYRKNRDVLLDVMLTSVFAELSCVQSDQDPITDEQVEHRITTWVEDKFDTYKKALKLIRNGEIEEYMKRHGGGFNAD